MTPIASDTKEMLDSLRTAITHTLERKQRLGQYAVVWQDGKPIRLNSEALDLALHKKNMPNQKQ